VSRTSPPAVLCGALRDALSAPLLRFASGSLTGSARVCTTRLATVVVDVDDAAVGCGGLGDFVGVVGGGQSGADVEVLADAFCYCEVADGPCEEGAGGLADAGVDRDGVLGGDPVGGEVVLPAQQVIIVSATNHTRSMPDECPSEPHVTYLC
jgi:hypothetical protein